MQTDTTCYSNFAVVRYCTICRYLSSLLSHCEANLAVLYLLLDGMGRILQPAPRRSRRQEYGAGANQSHACYSRGQLCSWCTLFEHDSWRAFGTMVQNPVFPQIHSYLRLGFSVLDITNFQMHQSISSFPRLRGSLNKPDARGECGTENDTLQSESGKPGRPALLSFDQMPKWFQHDNNQCIIRGYRPITNSARVSFQSWWYLHNETVNIYSHLIPAAIFFLGEWYLLWYLASRYNKLTSMDSAAFSIFMLTATICYTFSALYHTLMNHSHTMDRFCHRLDMLGIGIFIVGDIVLGVYIIFWCETTLRSAYWSMVSRSLYAPLFPSSDL